MTTSRTTSMLAAGLLSLTLFVTGCDSNVAAQPTGEKALAFAADDPRLGWSPCPPLFSEGCELAVLHGDPAQPNADIFFKVPAGYTIPRHTHTSAERMILVSGELVVTYDGQQAVVLRPGMYAYGPSEAPHKAECADAGACILFIAFEAPIDVHAVDPSAGQ